jgi:DNA polymerase-3 subunit epsilon
VRSYNKIFWIDTETSGINPDKHGIIELAIIVDVDGKIKDKMTFLMNPVDCAFNSEAEKVHGHTIDKVLTYKPDIEVKKAISGLMNHHIDKYDKNDKAVFAAYNADFDLKFIRALWNKANDNYLYSMIGAVLDPIRIIPMIVMLGLMPEPENLKLGTVAKALEIQFDENTLHGAMADIELTRKVFIEIVKRLKGLK